jgi:hypothetical protein
MKYETTCLEIANYFIFHVSITELQLRVVVWHSTGPEQTQAPQWDYTTFLNMEYNSLNKILVVRDWNMIQES